MNQTKKKVAKKKKDGNKLLIHLEASMRGDEIASDGDFHIKGSPINLASLLAAAIDTSHEFKRIVAMAMSAIEKDKKSPIENLLEGIMKDILDPVNHDGHGCDFDPKKKAPKKKITKKSK